MILLDFNPEKLPVLLAFLGALLLFGLIVYWFHQAGVKKIEDTQDKLSDKDFLLLFEEEPDGFLTVQRLLAKSKLTKAEAKFRFNYFHQQGLITYSTSGLSKYYYRLKKANQHRSYPAFSNSPFLTVEDILKIFKTCNYQVSLQDICLATGLPISIIKKEMRFFEKENLIEKLAESKDGGMTYFSFWVLKEPYRSNPDQFLALEEKLNLELEKIYQYEMRAEDFID